MELKKSDFCSALRQSFDELRGGTAASHYTDYVLTLLFVKYVSNKCAGKPNALLVLPNGGAFADTVKLRDDKINKIIGRLARTEYRLAHEGDKKIPTPSGGQRVKDISHRIFAALNPDRRIEQSEADLVLVRDHQSANVRACAARSSAGQEVIQLRVTVSE